MCKIFIDKWVMVSGGEVSGFSLDYDDFCISLV